MPQIPALDIIEALQRAIENWKQVAQDDMRYLQKSLEEAAQLERQLMDAGARLPTRDCSFCEGLMVDTSPLKPLVDVVRRRNSLGLIHKHFLFYCLACGTYKTSQSTPTALHWKQNEVGRKAGLFAAEIFNAFPEVAEVAYERMMGRGWMVKRDSEWFANPSTKAELRAKWNMA